MMTHTREAQEIMRLPVPNSEGDILLKVLVRPRAGTDKVETEWLTITFEQMAKIQNVLDNLL